MRNGIQWGIGCVLLLLSACRNENAGLVVPGVSRELAVYRKARIADLRYSLSFRIPEKPDEEIPAWVLVKFKLCEPDSLILDFRETADKLKKITVNGQRGNYRTESEHIVLPPQQLRTGENEIQIDFIAGEQSLNRNEDYLYTLLVPDRARTLFPCFDQPDLKARFTLELDVPVSWESVANAPEEKVFEAEEGRKQIRYKETEPLSTYLFSFVAGVFQRVSYTKQERDIVIYHRETDVRKQGQLPEIAAQVFAAMEWMENYTGVPYPFAKYDLILLPGFQFGGMEHAGATLYNDKRMFLSAHPTLNERLSQAELIAHETTHMWFGDYVTMPWFSDVWTKEVFANYFAARMVEPLFPEVNHDLNALKGFYAAAYSEDRTAGTTAIRQELDNLNNAGLIYGQIVYNKAPIVMRMLVELTGEEAFRKGIREYLATYAYANAGWEELIRILDRYTPEDLESWSRVWIDEKGMPEMEIRRIGEERRLCQQDRWERGVEWQQPVKIALLGEDSSLRWKTVSMRGKQVEIELDGAAYVLPGCDGKSYGFFAWDSLAIDFCLVRPEIFTDPLVRMAVWMQLNENYLHGKMQAGPFMEGLLPALLQEENVLIYTTLLGYLQNCCADPEVNPAEVRKAEDALMGLAASARSGEYRQQAFRTLLNFFRSPETTRWVYRIWEAEAGPEGLRLDESDYMKMAYELGIRMPDQSSRICRVQAGRLSNPDRLREFEYISRALVPEEARRDSLFTSLLKAENRRIEPWTATVLYYLNHPQRQTEALKYIRPSLEMLQEIQRTGDIFFPKNWVHAALRAHHSCQAADTVKQFLETHPDYPVLLKNKILQSADHLFRIKQK